MINIVIKFISVIWLCHSGNQFYRNSVNKYDKTSVSKLDKMSVNKYNALPLKLYEFFSLGICVDKIMQKVNTCNNDIL